MVASMKGMIWEIQSWNSRNENWKKQYKGRVGREGDGVVGGVYVELVKSTAQGRYHLQVEVPDK